MGGLTLKIKTKNGQHILNLNTTDTIDKLVLELSQLTSISTDRLSVLIGFPPKHLNITEDVSGTLATRGVTNGDTLIVNEAAPVPDVIASSTPIAPAVGPAADDANFIVQSTGILLKRIVPSDNSCLFTSIGKSAFTFTQLRFLPIYSIDNHDITCVLGPMYTIGR